MTIKSLYPTVRPTLNLNFARTKVLDPRITFTRASTATFVGADGLIKTAASGAARFDHNPATGESLGLLVEEARTNMAYPSIVPSATTGRWIIDGLIVTSSAGSAPDGTTTALLITPVGGTGNNRAYVYGGTVQEKTYSFFAKANTSDAVLKFTLQDNWLGGGKSVTYTFSTDTLVAVGSSFTVSRQLINNGWVRIFVTATPTNGAHYIAFNQGSVGVGQYFLWGFQEELAAFPTSYIPTVASTVTRAADVASMTGTNFSSWYNQSEGTLFQNCISRTPTGGTTGGTGIGAYLTSDSTDTQIGFARGSTEVTVYVYGSSTLYASFAFASQWAQNTTSKAIVAYKFNDFAASANGLTVQTDTSGVVPIATGLGIGQVITAAYNRIGAGTFSRIAYYPVRLPDAQLQALTS